MARMGITTSSMTASEREFYIEAMERRMARNHERARRRMEEQARRERLDRIGEALLVPALVIGFYAASILAFL